MLEVSVIIPVLNEEKYIRNCLTSLLNQNYPKENMEVLFIDGMSLDKTREIISEYQNNGSINISILNNEKRIIPCALNIGIKNAQGKYIVRMDAHTQYSNDYISKCIIEVLIQKDADNVGGSVNAKGKTSKQKAIAAAYHSKFGLGGGEQYEVGYDGYVETVFLGAFKSDLFKKIGMYDEAMARNEDDEFNSRIIKNGGRIYMSPEIKTVYYPRSSFLELFKQYFGYGEGKLSVLMKYQKLSGVKNTIPAFFILFVILGGLLFLFPDIWKIVYLSFISLYVLSNLVSCLKSDRVDNIFQRLELFWAHIVIHVSYGLGFMKGFLNKFRNKIPPKN